MIQMNKKPTFTMLVGLPGSGKSTYAEKIKGAVICSSDAIREELTGDINSQKKNDEVFKVLHQRVKENLRAGNDVIYDACNISSKRRKAFLDELKHIECEKICVVIAIPYEDCLEQNQQRQRKVPGNVIERMYMHWNTPAMFEGWDEINVIRNNTDLGLKINDFSAVMFVANSFFCFLQHNPHHSHTLGGHLISTYNYKNENDTIEMKIAKLLHDVGKPFCKVFHDSKGNPTDIAHYYCHENTGAYDVLCLNMDWVNNNSLDVSILINLHMKPYDWERNGNSEKYRKLWGENLYDAVMCLHEADKNAH